MNLLNLYFIINVFLMGAIFMHSHFMEGNSIWNTLIAMLTTLFVGLPIFLLFLLVYMIDSIKRKR
jgi:hypothetical protein